MASMVGYRRFWSLVWPHLEAGAWRYDLQPGLRAEEDSADHADIVTPAVAEGGLVPDPDGSNEGFESLRGCDNRCGSISYGNKSGGDTPEKDDCGGGSSRGSRGGGNRRRRETAPVPIFFPPAVGVASEGLERALHRDPPPGGKVTGRDRIERLEGIDAVVDLLQRVPGYPGTSSAGSVASMDAVAAAARAVLVPPVARREEQLSLRNEGASRPSEGAAEGSDASKAAAEGLSSSSSSSSASLENNDSARARRPVGGRIVRRRTPTVNCFQRQPSPRDADHNTQDSAPQIVLSSSVDGKDGSEDTENAATTSRTGRAIKKPVRLEDQDPGRQTLAGRSGRADALWRIAAREVAARTAAAAAGVNASAADATVSAADHEGPPQSNGIPPPSSTEVSAGQGKKRGAERCIARLGTSFGGGGAVARPSLPSTVRGWHSPSWGTGSSSGLGRRSRGDGHVNGTNASSARASSNGGTNGGGGGLRGTIAMKNEVNAKGALPSGACSGNTTMGLAAQAPNAGTVRCNGSENGGGGGSGSRKAGWSGHLIVPHPPPPRPIGMGYNIEETVKEYRRSFDDVIWPGLEQDHGWKKAYGPRNSDTYYLPRGVERGKNGAKCRLDFFDSYKQAIAHMVENGAIYDDLLERAWAKSITKPRPISKKSGTTGKARRKKSWTDINRRKRSNPNMMTPEHPRKVSAVGKNHQVDPKHLCPAVPSEEYIAPEDVIFEQVWDPKVMLPSERGGGSLADPNELVQEFAGSVSHDKCLEMLYRCGGDYYQARLKLLHMLRLWNAQFPNAMTGTKNLASARATAEKESARRIAEWRAIAGPKAEALPDLSKESPEDPEPEYLTRVTHWSKGEMMVSSKTAAIVVHDANGCGGGGAVSGQKVWTTADEKEFWSRPMEGMFTGEWALKRQIEGAIPTAPPEARWTHLPMDLNLSHPWSQSEAKAFTRVMVENGTKDFHVVQKSFPDRQICELVDRYYAGWKQTEGYQQLKEKLLRSKRQAACWVCGSGGDLICCDGCEGVYHVECAHLPQVPEGDWFCATCMGGNAAGEPGSSSCSFSSEPSAGYAPARAEYATVRANDGRNGPILSSDWRSRPGETVDNGGEGSGAAVAMQTGPYIGNDTEADTLLSSKRHHAADGSCGGDVWNEAGGSHDSETVSRTKKMRKKSGSSRRVRGGATWRAIEARGLERVPIYLGTARSVAGGASGSSRVPVTSTAPRMKRLPAASRPVVAPPEIQTECLQTRSAVLDACGGSSSDEPEISNPISPAQVTRIGVSPVMRGDAVGRRQPVSGAAFAPSTNISTHALFPSLDAPARVLARDRARALASAATSRPPAATSLPSARAPAPGPGLDPYSVNASATVDHFLDEEAAAEVEIIGVFEAGNCNEITEASWECRCCNRRNCGKDRRCRECDAARPMGSGARAARRDGKRSRSRSRVPRNQRTPALYPSESLNAAAAAVSDKAAARGKDVVDGVALSPSPWVCHACATYNKMNRVSCSSCKTKNARNSMEKSKSEWWCCSSCSRFNNRCHDGNRCRFCRANAPIEEYVEGDEEVISVGDEEELSSTMPTGGSERIAVRLPPT